MQLLKRRVSKAVISKRCTLKLSTQDSIDIAQLQKHVTLLYDYKNMHVTMLYVYMYMYMHFSFK